MFKLRSLLLVLMLSCLTFVVQAEERDSSYRYGLVTGIDTSAGVLTVYENQVNISFNTLVHNKVGDGSQITDIKTGRYVAYTMSKGVVAEIWVFGTEVALNHFLGIDPNH